MAASLIGACAGFLWWNAAPARIFMGDTGSLFIGAAIGVLALLENVDLLLPLIGGLYVLETLSVIAQVTSYRALRAAHIQDGARAPPLRARRLARDHGDSPLLDTWPGCSRPCRSVCSMPTFWLMAVRRDDGARTPATGPERPGAHKALGDRLRAFRSSGCHLVGRSRLTTWSSSRTTRAAGEAARADAVACRYWPRDRSGTGQSRRPGAVGRRGRPEPRGPGRSPGRGRRHRGSASRY